MAFTVRIPWIVHVYESMNDALKIDWRPFTASFWKSSKKNMIHGCWAFMLLNGRHIDLQKFFVDANDMTITDVVFNTDSARMTAFRGWLNHELTITQAWLYSCPISFSRGFDCFEVQKSEIYVDSHRSWEQVKAFNPTTSAIQIHANEVWGIQFKTLIHMVLSGKGEVRCVLVISCDSHLWPERSKQPTCLALCMSFEHPCLWYCLPKHVQSAFSRTTLLAG